MDKHILSLYDDTEPADDAARDTLGALHTEPWQAGPRRWRGWPVLGIGAVALGLLVAMNRFQSPAAPPAPAEVVAAARPAAPDTVPPAPSIDRSAPLDPAVDKPVDKTVDKPVDKPVGKSVTRLAPAPAPQPMPRPPASPEPAVPSTSVPAPLAPPAVQPDPPQALPQPLPPAPSEGPSLPSTSGE